MHDKIAHQQFKLSLLIVEKHHKGTEEHSDKNIGSGDQNALTANETQLKTKQLTFNIAHLITLIYSTQHFLQQEKFAVSGCKTKQFLLQALSYNFSREKSPVTSRFQIFKQNSRPLGFPPKRVTFRFFECFKSFFSSFLCMLMIG